MIKQNPITCYKEIAKRCLDHMWGTERDYGNMFGAGWDKGSRAHKWALKWAEKNFRRLKKLQWRQIYKEYKTTLVQE